MQTFMRDCTNLNNLIGQRLTLQHSAFCQHAFEVNQYKKLYFRAPTIYLS